MIHHKGKCSFSGNKHLSDEYTTATCKTRSPRSSAGGNWFNSASLTTGISGALVASAAAWSLKIHPPNLKGLVTESFNKWTANTTAVTRAFLSVTLIFVVVKTIVMVYVFKRHADIAGTAARLGIYGEDRAFDNTVDRSDLMREFLIELALVFMLFVSINIFGDTVTMFVILVMLSVNSFFQADWIINDQLSETALLAHTAADAAEFTEEIGTINRALFIVGASSVGFGIATAGAIGYHAYRATRRV